ILPPLSDEELLTQRAKLCDGCGYLHPIKTADGPDLCQYCGLMLGSPFAQLFRMQNVSTKRRDRINSDEEERTRMGYEIITGVRFAEHDGQPSYRTATVKTGATEVARLAYGQAATIWRINMGWNRRKRDTPPGFVLDVERGYWAKKEDDTASDPDDAPKAARTARVIPFVEDTRNCLLYTPSVTPSEPIMLSLMSALKRAVEAQFQLEDNELAAELLPSGDEPTQILLFGSAEGGAGVLRRLLDNSKALAQVAKRALEICHFDEEMGTDKRRAPNSREDCEAACYDCLMTYYNQRHHRLLDRHPLLEPLMELTRAEVHSSPVSASRNDHLEQLLRLAGSELEREWLRFLEVNQYRLPSKAQCLVERCSTRPDFLYEQFQTAIYVDGPHHEFPERQARDRAQEEDMLDYGYTVIRFDYKDNWAEVVARYPNIFGKK